MAKSWKIAIGVIITLVLFAVCFFPLQAYSEEHPSYKSESYTAEEPRVYVTKYGDCYHHYSCHYLSQSQIAKGLYEAQEKGYRVCSYCLGRSSGTITTTYSKQVETDSTFGNILISMLGAGFFSGIINGVLIVYVYEKLPEKRQSENENQ